jgi:hypothetical protein
LHFIGIEILYYTVLLKYLSSNMHFLAEFRNQMKRDYCLHTPAAAAAAAAGG